MKYSLFILFFGANYWMSCQPAQEPPAEDTAPTNVDIVRSIYDAFGEGNVEGVVAGMSEEVEWNEAESFIYADGNPYIGPDAVVEGIFVRIGADWEYWNLVEPVFREVEGGMVLVTGRYQAKHKTNGNEIDAQFAHVWNVEDGKVIRFQQYTDTKQVAEAALNAEETE